MRVLTRLLSALLAAALAATGLLASVEIALAGLGRGPWLPWPRWYRWALRHDFTATPVRVTLFGLAAAGLLLLVVACVPQRPVAFDVEVADPSTDAWVRRSSLEATLRRRAAGVDGIADAKVTMSARKVRIRARSNRRDIAGLPDALRRVAAQRLGELRLTRMPEIRVRVSPRNR